MLYPFPIIPGQEGWPVADVIVAAAAVTAGIRIANSVHSADRHLRFLADRLTVDTEVHTYHPSAPSASYQNLTRDLQLCTMALPHPAKS